MKKLKFLNNPNMAQFHKIHFKSQNLYDFILPFISGIFERPINKRALNANYVLYMDNFGKKIAECRKAKGYSQSELARKINTHYSIIGKYERDEMQPSIEASKKIAKLVDTTVGYLLSESEQKNVLKDPDMLKRLNEIEKMDDTDKGHILSLY